MSINQEKTVSSISHFKNIFLILIFNIILSSFLMFILSFSNVFNDFSNFLISFLVDILIFVIFPKFLFPANLNPIKSNNLIVIYNLGLACFLIILQIVLLIFPNNFIVARKTDFFDYFIIIYLPFLLGFLPFIKILFSSLVSIFPILVIWKYFDWKYKKS